MPGSALSAKSGKKKNKPLAMMLVIVALILILDQTAKFLISANLRPEAPYPVIKNIFYLTLVHNRGAAFGIFKNYTWLLIFTSLVAVGFIYFSLKSKHSAYKSKITRFAMALILSGALGNLIDRVRFGYVVDFLDFRIWPVFNVADSAITIGAVLLAFSILRKPSKTQIN